VEISYCTPSAVDIPELPALLGINKKRSSQTGTNALSVVPPNLSW